MIAGSEYTRVYNLNYDVLVDCSSHLLLWLAVVDEYLRQM